MALSERGQALIGSLTAQRDGDIRIVGVFDDRAEDRALVEDRMPGAITDGQRLGTVDELIDFARRKRIDLVIFALPISAENRILQMLKKLLVLPVDIRLAAHSTYSDLWCARPIRVRSARNIGREN
jgi:hypothetical protein